MKKAPVRVKTPQFPPWALSIFQFYAEEVKRLHQVVHLSIKGTSVLSSMPRFVEALNNITEELDHETKKKKLADAKETATFALREIETGFPVLHSLAVVNLWSTLEAMVHSLLQEWILNIPTTVAIEPIAKLRIRIGEYERLGKKERASYIVELLEKELAMGMRSGPARFEAILTPFGLNGHLDSELKKTLFELAQVRNVIAHRVGIVDQQFIDACPWLNLRINERLVVTHDMFRRYDSAFLNYWIVLAIRVRKHFKCKTAALEKLLKER